MRAQNHLCAPAGKLTRGRLLQIRLLSSSAVEIEIVRFFYHFIAHFCFPFIIKIVKAAFVVLIIAQTHVDFKRRGIDEIKRWLNEIFGKQVLFDP